MKQKVVCRIAVLVLTVGLAVGCSTMCKGPSDAEQVQNLLNKWKAAALEMNIDKMMATCADTFSHNGSDYQAADKAALKKFAEASKEEGRFDGVEISLDNAKTTIEGDTATITGVQWAISQGTVTINFTAKKTKAGWLFTDLTIVGL